MRMSNRIYRCRQAVSHDLHALSHDMRALMSATADMAGHEINHVRHRLSSAMEAGRDASGRMYGRAAHAAQTAGKTVREHPYQTLSVALALSALAGAFWRRRAAR